MVNCFSKSFSKSMKDAHHGEENKPSKKTKAFENFYVTENRKSTIKAFENK